MKKIKNIQCIDEAGNCAYDIFQIDEDDFIKIFPNGTNIQFIENIFNMDDRYGDMTDIEKEYKKIFDKVWKKPVKKHEVCGIHGTLFYGLKIKMGCYPNLQESDLDLNVSSGRSWNHG